MNSIADVLALTPGPSWHESVAIVQEIAAHLEPGQPLPAPEDLLLESDGSITFGFAGESARPQVADLASLLDTLLKKAEAPQALRDLASENARDEPAHASIASFTKALAFYERPNRRSDLQALAGRLEGRSQAAQADRTLAEIREYGAGYLTRKGDAIGPRLAELLERSRARVEEQIAELEDVRRRIDDFVAANQDRLHSHAAHAWDGDPRA